MSMRRPDVVELYVTTTTKYVVDVELFISGGDAVTREIPEDREALALAAVATWAEGEFIAEYDSANPDVVEVDDRDAIVIAAGAAGVELPDSFAGVEGYHSLFSA